MRARRLALPSTLLFSRSRTRGEYHAGDCDGTPTRSTLERSGRERIENRESVPDTLRAASADELRTANRAPRPTLFGRVALTDREPRPDGLPSRFARERIANCELRISSSAGLVQHRRPPMPTTLIKNGTVITATETMAADVLIDGEKVVALAAHGTQKWKADTVIDAKGRYVLPGGIDVHTHMELPFGGTYASDNFETGTRAAAFGGTTTIIDFAVQAKGGSAMEGYEAWRAKADGNVAIDYGLPLITRGIKPPNLKEKGG